MSDALRSRLYVGDVWHARHSPCQHTFRYPMWLLAIDVDELPAIDARLRLFGHNRGRPVSLHDGDYLGESDGSLRGKLMARLRAAGIETEPERIELLTSPRVLGHAFNPVSFWACYGSQARSPDLWVAEVNNTFGEGHLYVLPVDRADAGGRLHHAKEFHVSPFYDLEGGYEFRLAPPTEQLDLRIDLLRDGDRTLSTRLSAQARPLSGGMLARTLARYPLTVALTLPRILRQAASLYFRRGLPVHVKPEPSSERTFQATRPAYLSEFRAPPRLERWGRRWFARSGEPR